MRQLLRQREVVEDDWRYLGEESAEAAQRIVIPLGEWRDNKSAWESSPRRLGLRIGTTDLLQSIAPDLGRFELIAIEFAKNASGDDGRGYTQGRLLRERYGFKGELRAVGLVKRDQVFFLTRCGFDAFELAPGEDLEEAKEFTNRFTVAYQSAEANGSRVRFGKSG